MIPDAFGHQAYVAAEEAPRVLDSMNLDTAVLMDSVRVGVRQAQNINTFHPVTARGFTQWSDTVAYLRQALDRRGWTSEDPQNSPRVVGPEKTMSIMVVGGNSDTGVSLDLDPGTARRRGPTTKAAVQSNGQLTLELGLELPLAQDGNQPLTWILLYHWSRTQPEVRAELSLPVRITDEYEISRWSHRILLPPANLSDFDIPLRPAGPQDDVDFRITARS